jgi:hypothetical protein
MICNNDQHTTSGSELAGERAMAIAQEAAYPYPGETPHTSVKMRHADQSLAFRDGWKAAMRYGSALDTGDIARALRWFEIARRHIFVQPEDEALLAKLTGFPARPGVNWTPASKLPDVDTTVMLALADGEVWQGYFDGGVWVEVSGLPLAAGRVTHWKHTPSHPKDKS